MRIQVYAGNAGRNPVLKTEAKGYGKACHPIYNAQGAIIGTSRNLAGIRRYVASSRLYITHYRVREGWQGTGILSIRFNDGSHYRTRFADYSVLCDWSSRWRNAHGSPLYVNGKEQGKLSNEF